ncbi:protein of unknown function [Methylotuvimicrobium alcaliphilum 20Z]|uniref:Uncharacterized protein n=1 Tax=Methylotuvimicrobium alcaliphilum (strain DSM 19304 / NCIMB 14124 / VKM B-2133 / 20Z) TaxID=1091494 RepID=G4T1K1_META2|nr:protein of unknown function [Methylotuvimicrobium alcaliphilum 20Z]
MPDKKPLIEDERTGIFAIRFQADGGLGRIMQINGPLNAQLGMSSSSLHS